MTIRGQSTFRMRSIARSVLAVFAFTGALSTMAFTMPWKVGDPWPDSSDAPVAALAHRPLAEAVAELPGGPEAGFRVAIFGDQRALADGEWQAIMAAIAAKAETDPRLLFMLDTGDIVFDGRHTDQFAMLAEILSPARNLPYLTSVGNHELKSNRGPEARGNTATCLSEMDPAFSVQRMYFEKRIGRLRLLVLDSNDFIYGDDGEADPEDPLLPGSRGEAQWRWLAAALAKPELPGRFTVVAIHHPFLQSSRMHRRAASALWNRRVAGRNLAELFLDGGVDLVLSGNTHTFEHFRLEREGKGFDMINVSGRPRSALFGFGASRRRARDLREREWSELADHGWLGLDGWSITQVDAMLEEEANQFLIMDLPAEGAPSYRVHYLDEDAADGLRVSGSRILN
jgi:hypothetical protein